MTSRSIPGSTADDVDPAFPDIVDDAAPEGDGSSEPQVPALPGDDYLGVNAHGTTLQEQLEGPSLTERLEAEVPEPDPYAEPAGRRPSDNELDTENRLLSDPEGMYPGRLVESDEGAHTDLDKELVAREALGAGDDLSPEELAMHIEPEVP